MKSFMLMVCLLLTNFCFALEIDDDFREDKSAPPQVQNQPSGTRAAPYGTDDPETSLPRLLIQ